MKNGNTKKQQATRGVHIACVTALVMAFTAALAQAAHADSLTPPPVPAKLEVPVHNVVYLVGHAVGTQNYSCVPCDPTKPDCPFGVAWTLFTPQATLFDDQGEQIIHHFFSPNPLEPVSSPFANGIVRATWQHSRDTSTVWAKALQSATFSTDPDFVRSDAIAWVLLQVKDVGAQAGPTGGDKLTGTTFIQRVNTVKGLAPATGCEDAATDIGRQAFRPYRADYVFYKDGGGNVR
jgi:Protein of unknown function (DUF3455)